MPSSQGRRNPTVLVIGKDPALRDRLHRVLAGETSSVLTVLTIDDALNVMKHEWPAVVLVDPPPTDAETHALVSRLRAVNAALPIIVFSTTQPLAERVATQVQAVLRRDASDETLLAEVRRWRSPPSRQSGTRWPGSILVVDNEPKIRQILQQFLHDHGFAVATADSGAAAVEAVKQSSPSVVLLDIAMPGMDGLAALRQIKALRPATTVIMVTGLEEEQTMGQALALGADDYVLKPFNLEYLETTVLSKLLIGHTP